MTSSPSTRTDTTPRRPHLFMWLAVAGVCAVVVLALVADPWVAGLALAALLLVLAVIRVVSGRSGPYGIASRSRGFDTTFLVLGATAIAVLTLTADNL